MGSLQGQKNSLKENTLRKSTKKNALKNGVTIE